MADDQKHFDLKADHSKETHAFIQWKGTDVCMDFKCECGTHCHFDGMFAYAVKCPECGVIWQMPELMFPRRCDLNTYKGVVIELEEWTSNNQARG